MSNRLPTELWFKILENVQQSIGSVEFEVEAESSMYLHAQWVNNLLRFSEVHRDWTPRARFKLFRDIRIKNGTKAQLFLDLMEKQPELAQRVTSVRFGEQHQRGCYNEGLNVTLNRIAAYCPNINEISCSSSITRLEDFSGYYCRSRPFHTDLVEHR